MGIKQDQDNFELWPPINWRHEAACFIAMMVGILLWVVGPVVLAGLLMALFASPARADNCRQFFAQKYVASYAQAYVAPVYAPLYYQAGRDIEAEALAEKVARLVTQKLELRQQQREAIARPQSVIAQHCAKCHSGATPKAGLTFDGATSLPSPLVTAALRQIKSEAMPKDHKIPPEVKAALMDELLNLEAEQVQPVVPRDLGEPLPRPRPDDGELR